MASWRLPGSFWAAVGRKMACKTAPDAPETALGSVLAALGLLLAPIWAVLVRPGGPLEIFGCSGEGLREAIVALF